MPPLPDMKKVLYCLIVFGLTPLLALRAAEPDVVRVGTFKFVSAAPAYYMGVLAPKYNLKLDYQFFTKGADIIPAVVAGQVDVATTAVDAAVAARSAGIPIYVQIITMAYTDINQAMMRKDIDAACQPEPQASQSIRLGFGKEVIKPYQTMIGEPIRTLLFTEDLYNKRPDVARRLLECFVESTKFLLENPEQAEKFVRVVVFKNQLSHEDYIDSVGNMKWSYDATAAEIDATALAMKKFGLAKIEGNVKGQDFVKTDRLIEAKKKFGVK